MKLYETGMPLICMLRWQASPHLKRYLIHALLMGIVLWAGAQNLFRPEVHKEETAEDQMLNVAEVCVDPSISIFEFTTRI